MALKKEMNDALNNQIKNELESAYIYLGMSTWLRENAYDNLANWYYIQTKEELIHALKFIKFIIDAGGSVELKDINVIKNDWNSVEEIVKAGLDHEKFITGKIYELVDLADKLKQYSVKPLLTWFIDEQVEEEDNASDLVAKQKAFKNDMLFNANISRKDTTAASETQIINISGGE
jgi:ferritin